MEILRNISRRKLRSFLTISGIVIGVLALTTMAKRRVRLKDGKVVADEAVAPVAVA